VIGLGTQDDFAFTQSFRSTTGVFSAPLLWDPSFSTWQQLGVVSNSSFILFDPGLGQALEGWFGFSPSIQTAVLERAAQG